MAALCITEKLDAPLTNHQYLNQFESLIRNNSLLGANRSGGRNDDRRDFGALRLSKKFPTGARTMGFGALQRFLRARQAQDHSRPDGLLREF